MAIIVLVSDWVHGYLNGILWAIKMPEGFVTAIVEINTIAAKYSAPLDEGLIFKNAGEKK